MMDTLDLLSNMDLHTTMVSYSTSQEDPHIVYTVQSTLYDQRHCPLQRGVFFEGVVYKELHLNSTTKCLSHSSLLDPDIVTEAGEACVGDYDLVLLQEDVFGVEIFMDNSSCMEVAHCLGNLATNVDAPF